jgi:Domain of unknown function (DUF4082)
MKSIKKTFVILLITFFSFSCSKSDDNNTKKYPEENFISQFLIKSGVGDPIDFPDRDNFEVGFVFKPIVNGKINSLVIKVPQANNSLKVTLWDKVTGDIIKVEIVNVGAGANTIKVIDPIPLVKDKEYVLSFTAKSYYGYYVSQDYIHYPINCGNISIIDSVSTTGANMMPISPSTLFYGNLSFNFQQTE